MQTRDSGKRPSVTDGMHGTRAFRWQAIGFLLGFKGSQNEIGSRALGSLPFRIHPSISKPSISHPPLFWSAGASGIAPPPSIQIQAPFPAQKEPRPSFLNCHRLAKPFICKMRSTRAVPFFPPQSQGPFWGIGEKVRSIVPPFSGAARIPTSSIFLSHPALARALRLYDRIDLGLLPQKSRDIGALGGRGWD